MRTESSLLWFNSESGRIYAGPRNLKTIHHDHVRQDFQTEQYRGPFVPPFSYENNQFANTIQVPQHNSPLVGAHGQKQERYIPYKDHQNSSNSTIGTQSIDTNFVPSNGCTVKSTKSIADEFTGTSSADSTCIELDQNNLGERMARLEKTFNRITELANSQFSVQLKPYPQVQATLSHNPQVSSLHDPQASSLHGPQGSSSHAPPASLLHDSQAFLLHNPKSADTNEEHRGKLRDQYIMSRGSNRLRSSTDCPAKPEAVRIKLELGSETIGLTSISCETLLPARVQENRGSKGVPMNSERSRRLG